MRICRCSPVLIWPHQAAYIAYKEAGTHWIVTLYVQRSSWVQWCCGTGENIYNKFWSMHSCGNRVKFGQPLSGCVVNQWDLGSCNQDKPLENGFKSSNGLYNFSPSPLAYMNEPMWNGYMHTPTSHLATDPTFGVFHTCACVTLGYSIQQPYRIPQSLYSSIT